MTPIVEQFLITDNEGLIVSVVNSFLTGCFTHLNNIDAPSLIWPPMESFLTVNSGIISRSAI